MTLQVCCRYCGTVDFVPEDWADKPLRCPQCHRPLEILRAAPGPPAEPEPAPGPAAEPGSGQPAVVTEARQRSRFDAWAVARLLVWGLCGALTALFLLLHLAAPRRRLEDSARDAVTVLMLYVLARAAEAILGALRPAAATAPAPGRRRP